MKTLYLFKSEPDNKTNQIIHHLKTINPDAITIELYKDDVDWDRVVDLVFIHEKVICWW
jgi:hypothetical protein